MHDSTGQPGGPELDAPVATYRLQMRPEFTFSAAREAIPYLQELGVSHLYLSPIWQATPGSQHGYDIRDHSAINPELGGMAEFIEFSGAAHAAGLSIIADIVPNHVDVSGEHAWWNDVLRFGQESPYAPYFDIDWSGRGDVPAGLLVLPVLGAGFGAILESGELKLDLINGELGVRYWERRFPLRPSTYSEVIGVPPAEVVARDAPAFGRLLRTADELRTAKPEAARPLLLDFGRLVEESAPAREWLASRIEFLNGRPGEAASFDELDRILSLQHYRLSYWRVSTEQINYRRFFDVNNLAAVRMEYEPAFRDTHRLVAELVAGGHIDGLRVDHVDGLNDPADYLAALSELCPVPIWVEKILAPDEELPQWPVAGTTGYDFAAALEPLFYDPAGRRQVLATYSEFTGENDDYPAVAFASRRWIADRAFDGDISGLSYEFHRLAQNSRRHRDITVRGLRDALTALLASFPRYRTYSDANGPSEQDCEAIEAAARTAAARAPDVTPEALAFLVEVLAETSEPASEGELLRRRHLAQRVQQVASPIMAKGVEDTAFFRFTPFLCQNEVGNSPGREPPPPSAVHEWLARRAEQWPSTLNATSTHDTKRSEDARMRLAALSEFAREWRRELRSWARLNERLKTDVSGERQPLPQTEQYLYQMILASWDFEGGPGYADRIVQHMQKASREAKTWTSWVQPNEPAEAAVEAFARAILHRRRGARFRARLDAFVRRIQPAAESNSLALVALKCLAPGVPDFYQGSERELLTLTDPDNRVLVQFGCDDDSARQGSAKTALVRRLLAIRRECAAPLSSSDYRPLRAEGELAGHVFGFARMHGAEGVALLVRRRVGRALESGALGAGATNTSVELPPGNWRDPATGEALDGVEAVRRLAASPVVVLVS